MLTVPQAAKRTGRNPETIRRWIREGRLPAGRVGTQHLIEEADLDAAVAPTDSLIPASWRVMKDGSPLPDVVAIVREIRDGG